MFDQVECIRREIEAVIGRDTIFAQRLRQAVNGFPVQLDTRADDQHVIADFLSHGCRNGVILRIKRADCRFDPLCAGRNQVLFLAVGEFGRKGTAANHRPAGLVIMVVGRVDDRQRDIPVALQHAGGGRDTGGAAADDDDVEFFRGRRCIGRFGLRHLGQFCRPGT